MRRVRTLIIVMITMSFLLTGCGLYKTVDLTEEQSALVAEYAASLLLKYDSKHTNGLMEITDEPIIIKEEEPIAEPAPEAAQQSAEVTDVKDTDLIAEAAAVEPSPLQETLHVPDFEITYKNYEICDLYPEAESEDLVFSMQAQQGHDLIILHFDLKNPTGEAAACDIVTNTPLCRLIVNEETRLNRQTTILPNDLGDYMGTVEAGESVDTVMVFEIEESMSDQIEQMSLLINTPEAIFTYPLN